MPDFLTTPFANPVHVKPGDVAVRLIIALLLGGAVAWIYKRTRKSHEITPSFPVTLILLSVLIAMVTQVVGDNVARAFSLVGALSIVRFRTVVRDTEDTAYVIFAVVVGMAVGASHPWVALIGLLVIGAATFIIKSRGGSLNDTSVYVLNLRVGLGNDIEKIAGALLDEHLAAREVMSIATTKQGSALDVTFETRFKSSGSADELVRGLNRTEGIQAVQLTRQGFDQN